MSGQILIWVEHTCNLKIISNLKTWNNLRFSFPTHLIPHLFVIFISYLKKQIELWEMTNHGLFFFSIYYMQ